MATRKRAERRPQKDARRPPTDEVIEPHLARGELSDALPEGWEVVAVRDKYIFTQKPRDLRYGAFSAIPFVPMDLIPFRKIAFNNYVLKKPDELTSGTYFEAGDILLPKITPSFENGKQGIVSELPHGFGIATTEVIPIKQIDGVSNAHFLFYYLLKDDVRASLAGKMEGSTGRQRLSKSVVENLVIPFPPLPEQRAIARVLSTIQRAIETQDKLITAARRVKKALMRHLFTYGAVPPAAAARVPLKETEIGAVPEGWEVVKLGNIVESLDHRRIPLKSSDRAKRRGNIPYYGASGIIDWIDEYIFDEPVLLVSEDGANLQSRTLPIAYIVDGKCWVNNHAHVLRARNGNREFIQNYVNNIDLSDYLSGTTRPKLNQAMLMEIRIPSPSVSEQRAIARILAAVDKKIAVEEKRKAALQALFKTTLHQLMTGQVRVKAEG